MREKYQHYPDIDLKAAKCLFVGPPRVGKTATKLHLLGDIEKLHEEHDSTGLDPPIEVSYVISDAGESCFHNLTMSELAGQLINDVMSQEFIPTPEESYSKSLPHTHTADSAADEGTAYALQYVYENLLPQAKEEVIKHLNESTTMYLIDTGGQPEFHDILPLMLRGPAFYFIFFNMVESLDKEYTVECKVKGTHVIPYQSGVRIKDVICQLLNTFAYFSSNQKEESCPLDSQVFVFATHLDELYKKVKQEIGESEFENVEAGVARKIEELDSDLHAFLECDEIGAPQEKILVNASAGGEFGFKTLFIPIGNRYENNQKKDEKVAQSVKKIRQLITSKVQKCCRPVKIKTPWLFFHLVLRDTYKKVCTYKQSEELAQRCNIGKDDVKGVLRFIYLKLGTILFFESIRVKVQSQDEDDLIVICSPEVIYKCVSDLIFQCYTKVAKGNPRLTGRIQIGTLEDWVEKHSPDKLIGTEYIIKVLEHFKIISRINEERYDEYFMPCLLRPNEDKDTVIDACPLMVCFPFTEKRSAQKCNIIPIGLATALVVELHSSQSWKLNKGKQKKNNYRFRVHGCDVVLVIKAKYIELNVEDPSGCDHVSSVRGKLRCDLMRAVKKVSKCLEYSITPEIRFYCSKSTCSDVHLAVYDEDSGEIACQEAKCATETKLLDLQKAWLKVSYT